MFALPVKNTLHCHCGFDHFEDWKYKEKASKKRWR
jgi:hypothetical protein